MVKVFVTMLAAKDSDHICRLDAYRIGKKCHISEVEVLEILKVLASPDTRRVGPQEHEGRRIQAVEDGWFILNGEKYRQMVSDEMRKARLRRAQASFRERQKKEQKSPKAKSQAFNPSNDVEIPQELQTHGFRKAWESWLGHLKEKNSKTTPSAYREQMEKCRTLGEVMAIDAIKRSIASNWQGIYEDKNNGNKNTANGRQPSQRVDRSIGTSNEGTASLYKGLGKVS